MMLTFDEVRREAGVQEDTLKVLIAGGLLPMRRNHEPETRYHSFEYCAKTWLMNSADIPSLPTALETSHSRRFLCTFMRNSLTHDGSQVDISQCRFLSDPDAKSFCASPAAVWTFYNDWLLPYMEANCPRSSQKLLTEIDPNSQTAKDRYSPPLADVKHKNTCVNKTQETHCLPRCRFHSGLPNRFHHTCFHRNY